MVEPRERHLPLVQAQTNVPTKRTYQGNVAYMGWQQYLPWRKLFEKHYFPARVNLIACQKAGKYYIPSR